MSDAPRLATLAAELGIDLEDSKRLRAMVEEVDWRPGFVPCALIEIALRAYAMGRDDGWDEGVCK